MYQPERDFSRVRGVGSLVLAVEVGAGTLLVIRYGRRLGSPTEMADEVFPESVRDSLMVIGALVASALVVLVLFRLAGRRWERARTNVDPAASVMVGVVFVACSTGLAYQSQVVPFVPPATTFAEGRAVLDELVAALAGDGAPVATSPGEGVVAQTSGPPGVRDMAASLEGGAEACRDAVGRDMGSVSLVWTHQSVVVVPLTTLEGLQWRGNAVIEPVLPLRYVYEFRNTVHRALRVSGFAVVDESDEYTIRITGTRTADDPASGPSSYTFATEVRLADQLPQRRAQLEAAMTLRSPCLRVGR